MGGTGDHRCTRVEYHFAPRLGICTDVQWLPPDKDVFKDFLNWFVRGQDIESGASEERWASEEVGEWGEKGLGMAARVWQKPI